MSRKSRAAAFVDEGYDISVSGRNVHVTDAMKDYAMEKIAKIERLSPRIIDVMATMDIQKLDHKVDIVMKVGNTTIKSHAVSDDMYASIDKAVHKLESQLKRYKTRLQDHHAKGVSAVDMNVNVIQPHADDDVHDINDEIEEENGRQTVERYRPAKLIARETRPLKTLTLDEAVMKMELSSDIFMVYRAEEDRSLKVIYRRNDGNYGVIEPDK